MTDTSETLSEREVEILRLVATGVSNKEIATALSISPNTVKVHLRNIFAKIGVLSRTEATLYAIKNGIAAQPAGGNDHFTSLEPYAPPASTSPLALAPEQAPEAAPPRRMSWRGVLLWATIVIVVLVAAIYISNNVLNTPAAPATTPAAVATSITPRWQVGEKLPGPRAGMGAVTYGNQFYLVGGETPEGVSGDLLVYNLNSQAWSALPEKPTPVSGVQAALIGEKIYVPGGRRSDGSLTNVLEVYDPRQERWEKQAALPAALSDYALTAFEGNLFLFGGWNGQGYSQRVYRYDPDLDQWKTSPLTPGGRSLSAASTLDGQIILLGGRDSQGALDEVWIYYPNREGESDSAWEEGPRLPDARYGLAAATLANSVYVIGGQSAPGDDAQHPPLVLVPDAQQWQAIGLPAQEIGEQTALLSAGNFLHVLGGQSPAGLASEHLVYQALYTVAVPLIANEGVNPTPP